MEPPSPFLKAVLSFQNFPKRGWGSDFSHKKGGVGKAGGSFKKGKYRLFSYWLNLFSVNFLWVFGVHVCVFFICTFFISILCIPREEFSLTESNQQICTDFYKGVIFEKLRQCGNLWSKFLMAAIIYSMKYK